MQITRRNFLKYCIGSAAALGLELSTVGRLQKLLAADGGGLPQVVWINGANCTGCTISLANHIAPEAPTDAVDLLINTIDLVFHPNLMGAAGDSAVAVLNAAVEKDFVLVIDGGIPTAFGGNTCVVWSEGGHEVTALEAVRRLAPLARAVVCVGTCASFGGVPSGGPNITGIRSVRQITGVPTVNIPGCPPHPDWIVGTLARFIAGVPLDLDSDSRPRAYFDSDQCNVHKRCPRKGREKAEVFGLDGHCMKELGCRGPQTDADCPTRFWNNGTNWCIGANTICIGCTENGFPDKFSPFFSYALTDSFTGNGGKLQVTKAEWKADKKELQIEGQAAAAAQVKVTDSAGSVLLGVAVADQEGKWQMKIQNPPTVPSTIRVSVNGSWVETRVAGAPENTDGESGSSQDGQLRISKAEWKKDTRELKVEGKARARSKVILKNASTGSKFAEVKADSGGTWKVSIKNLAQVPCRVLAESGKSQVSMEVKNASGICT